MGSAFWMAAEGHFRQWLVNTEFHWLNLELSELRIGESLASFAWDQKIFLLGWSFFCRERLDPKPELASSTLFYLRFSFGSLVVSTFSRKSEVARGADHCVLFRVDCGMEHVFPGLRKHHSILSLLLSLH